MRILLATATAMEQPTLSIPEGIQLERLVHGCGLMESTFHLSRALANLPNIVIQAGLAGTYTNNIPLGETVVVGVEQSGDTGAEEQDGRFLSLYELGLSDPNTPPFAKGQLPNPHTHLFPKHLKIVKGLTVNQCAGSTTTIAKRMAFQADIETMEGAAFHYVALQSDCQFIQFRGISNMVEPRNRAAWQIPQAMANLQLELQRFIHSIATP